MQIVSKSKKISTTYIGKLYFVGEIVFNVTYLMWLDVCSQLVGN